ncbi:ATP-binding cassette domain-containing protein [Amycolatopsis sp. CA-230715]|uniref:ATP-binding cassette domain-containing protein n=1 Tax=Amycolatopsis sp. CA-230715 TaxID=2745196 RepID=UPI001C00B981|nr:ATP-binding cassette domain-containing protein [Amycolatopsis sp. CA-230715]QWF82466.1 Daunorubicin/doxorubicin resistance ATP-binding protein DrrA [Amycolatopsis sp. CA-230715]
MTATSAAPVVTATERTPAIRAAGLKKRFGEKWAVDGVDLTVPPGQIYAFLGPNGAGKSTCVRMMCTLLAPTEGTVSVLGHDTVRNQLDVRLRVGVALQATALDDKQTGLEQLRLQGRFYGLGKKTIGKRVGELTELIDLGDAVRDRVGTYSGGMRRRLDLAVALIHNPRVLFLDEPTTGMDPASRIKLWAEVNRLNRELGTTIFMTTQYLEEADQLAERVGIINEGKVVAEGSPEELKRSIGKDLIVATTSDGTSAEIALRGLPVVQRVDVNGEEVTIAVEDGPTAISPVALALAENAVTVRNLVLRRPTLDDVFLSITGQHMSEEDALADAGKVTQ